MKYIVCQISFLVCVFLFPIMIQAQKIQTVEHYTNENDLFKEESKVYYLLANDVILRSEANKESEVLDKLKIGTSFRVLKKSPAELTVKSVKSNWYQIKTATKTGWIWGGFIAQYAFGSESDATVKFVAGIEKFVFSEDLQEHITYYQIRAFRNNEQIDKITLKSPGWEFDEIFNLGQQGLKNVADVLVLNIPCSSESCGCTVGESYVFWDNEKFHYVGDALGIVDADYSSYETFIFPANMKGKPNIIIKERTGVNDEKTFQNGEDAGNINTIYREIKCQEFEWNGIKLVAIGEEKLVKVYKVEY